MGAPGSNTLPATSPFGGTLWLTTAQPEGVGAAPCDVPNRPGYAYPGVDGYVGVASNATLQANGGFSWSFSPTATPAANQYYLVATLEHEFREVLGRDSSDGTNAVNNVPSYTIMDLFRYSSPGTVGLHWQFAGIAPIHAAGASDLVLRNVNTGQFEVYDIAGNTLVGAASLGTVGLDWQLGGLAVDPPTNDASIGLPCASDGRI
jgi:hypothetical protein